ncbi:MAG: CBS domain-containing protein [archaeon GB-1867-005]|nr:CBS domain-containing protein [Candidatus Culexmicrobium cathedralense]
MKVKDIMTTNVIYAEVPGTREQVLRLMTKHKVMGLPVVKKGTKRVVGIVTRTDLMKKPMEEQLALLMTRDPITVNPETPINEVARILWERDIRRLPVVVGDNELVGVITVADIVYKAIANMNVIKPIKDFVTRKITAVWEKTPLPAAYTIMRLAKVQALPVIDSKGKLTGIISDSDIISVCEITLKEHTSATKAATEGQEWDWDTVTILYISSRELTLPDKPVEEVMVKRVITAVEQTPVSLCARKMRRYDIDQLPVLDAKGNLIGMIRDIDLLQILFK